MMGTCKSPGAFRTGRCLQKTMTRNAKEEAGKEEAGKEEAGKEEAGKEEAFGFWLEGLRERV